MRALEERVTDAIHHRLAAILRRHVLDGIAGAQIVDDGGAGLLQQERLGQQRRHEIAGNELAVFVDEEAAIGVAVPGDADLRARRFHPRDDVAAVFLDQRVGFVSGEGAVDREAQRVDLARQRLEELRRRQPGHAASGIEHDLEWLDDGRIDEAEHVLDVPIENRPLASDRRASRPAAGIRLPAIMSRISEMPSSPLSG